MKSNNSLVWLITGTSQGFGHDLVRTALERGDCVIASSRNPQKVSSDFKNASDRLLTISLDLRNAEQIKETIASAIAHFGKIDVLINNAGYGLLGAVEEASDTEITDLYQVNVFGLLRVIQAVLPHMRERRSGNIVNISSVAGLIGIPGWGIYCSSKFAVEGISETLAIELAPIGIHVTIVEPGPFRTNFLGDSMKPAGKKISDYEQTAGLTRGSVSDRNGKQEGDPVLAAEAIIQAVTSEKPPLHLLLGGIAYERAINKIDTLRNEFNEWRELTMSSDYPVNRK